MDEKLKQTLETLEKALADTEEKLKKLETELANPFLKADLRVKYKKVAGNYADFRKKLKTQIKGLKMLGDISTEELERLRNL